MTTIERPALPQPTQLEVLTSINILDFLSSFGLENLRGVRILLGALSWLPARRFASQMMHYDHLIAEQGLHYASKHILDNYVKRLEVEGQENIPTEGPLLVLSNHPGMTDTLTLFASLPRENLRIIAAERPFLETLPALSRKLIYVPEDTGQRMGVVRNVVSHLRAGGAVLTFPAGQIEPDPITMPGAIASLADWSESIAIFSRLVPDVKIIVAIVSGVIWPATTYSPITRLRRKQKDRERLGAALQMLIQIILPFYKPVTTRVVFSPAFNPADVTGSSEPTAITKLINTQARQLIDYSMAKHQLEMNR